MAIVVCGIHSCVGAPSVVCLPWENWHRSDCRRGPLSGHVPSPILYDYVARTKHQLLPATDWHYEDLPVLGKVKHSMYYKDLKKAAQQSFGQIKNGLVSGWLACTSSKTQRCSFYYDKSWNDKRSICLEYLGYITLGLGWKDGRTYSVGVTLYSIVVKGYP